MRVTLETILLETSKRDPEFLDRLIKGPKIFVLDEETGIYMNENTLLALELL